MAEAAPDSASSDSIGIVTAFFDIGRSGWTVENGHPHYLLRTTETYIERFGMLASLDNEMVIYTSEELAPRVLEYRKGKEDRTIIVPLPFKEMFPEKRASIARVQQDPAFKAKIAPAHLKDPECWSVDYVLVTNLKAFFVAHALQNNFIKHAKQVAWLDFGYCRTQEALGGKKEWRYPFTPGKIHLFGFHKYEGNISLFDIVHNNMVFIAGAAVVAQRELWLPMAQLMNRAADELMVHNLVDDDQTLFLMTSLYRPDLFELHLISDSDWQPVLRLFNEGPA